MLRDANLIFFAPDLRFSRRHSWQGEENRREQAPEDADGAGDAKSAEGRIARPTSRTETETRARPFAAGKLLAAGSGYGEAITPGYGLTDAVGCVRVCKYR